MRDVNCGRPLNSVYTNLCSMWPHDDPKIKLLNFLRNDFLLRKITLNFFSLLKYFNKAISLIQTIGLIHKNF